MNPVISIPELLVLGIYYFVICFEGFPFFDFTDTAQQYCIITGCPVVVNGQWDHRDIWSILLKHRHLSLWTYQSQCCPF